MKLAETGRQHQTPTPAPPPAGGKPQPSSKKKPWCNTELPGTDLAASCILGTWSRSEAKAAATTEYQVNLP